MPAHHLRHLVLKELGDNGLDPGASVTYGAVKGARDTFVVADDGPGLDGTPEEIAELFSIRRPLRSTKLLRLPQRGQLGNGLRVVAGAVLAGGGTLTVITRGRRIALQPQLDGSTSVVSVSEADQSTGTRVEVGFGTLKGDAAPFDWIKQAVMINHHGETYSGRSSPFWHDGPQFHELILACGAQPVRSLVAQLDGCTGGKAGEIVAAVGLDRRPCQDVSREEAIALLRAIRKRVRPVNVERLGFVGRDAFSPESSYAKAQEATVIGSGDLKAQLPYVVEA